MIESPNYSQRSGRPVTLIILHTAEGARTTASLGSWFSVASRQVSSHVGIDDYGLETYVPYSMASWTTPGGANSIADQAELCGFAAWTREQWLTEHRPMLELAARWIRERCLARGIPIRKLTPAQVGAGESGVCGHGDWSIGMRPVIGKASGDHTDPGPGLPWDVVMQLATGGQPSAVQPSPSTPAVQEDDPMTPIELHIFTDNSFRGASICEAGASVSSVVDKAWVVFGITWGSADVLISFLGPDGLVMGAAGQKRAQLPNNGRIAIQAPDGSVMVTVEGKVTANSIPTAAVLAKPRP